MVKIAAMSRKALRDERKTGTIDSQIVEARSMGRTSFWKNRDKAQKDAVTMILLLDPGPV